MCFRLGPLCVSGLDRTAMCFRLGPDRFVFQAWTAMFQAWTTMCFRLGPILRGPGGHAGPQTRPLLDRLLEVCRPRLSCGQYGHRV